MFPFKNCHYLCCSKFILLYLLPGPSARHVLRAKEEEEACPNVLPTEILGISSICFCLGPIVRQFSFIFIVLEMSSLSGEDTQNMPTVRSYNLKTHKSGIRGTFQNKTSQQRRQNCFDHTNQTISKLCEEGKGIVQSRVDTIFSPLMSDYNFANLKTGNTWSIDGDEAAGRPNIIYCYIHILYLLAL